MEPSNGSQSDLNPVLESGVLEYIQQLKQAGTVRHVGLSSHTPRLVNKVLDMGVIDLVVQHQPRIRLPPWSVCHRQRG